jgi:hypothetical protein
VFKRIVVGALAALAFMASPALAQPDLTVEMSGRSDRLGGQTYAIGQPILISFRVINQGDAAAPGTNSAGGAGYMADVIVSTDNTAPVRFATYTTRFAEDALLRGGRMSRTDDVPAGGRVTFEGPTTMLGTPPAPYNYLSFPLPAGMRPGNYHICVQVDPGARIAESNEINNTTCMPITLVRRLPVRRP